MQQNRLSLPYPGGGVVEIKEDLTLVAEWFAQGIDYDRIQIEAPLNNAVLRTKDRFLARVTYGFQFTPQVRLLHTIADLDDFLAMCKQSSELVRLGIFDALVSFIEMIRFEYLSVVALDATRGTSVLPVVNNYMAKRVLTEHQQGYMKRMMPAPGNTWTGAWVGNTEYERGFLNVSILVGNNNASLIWVDCEDTRSVEHPNGGSHESVRAHLISEHITKSVVGYLAVVKEGKVQGVTVYPMARDAGYKRVVMLVDAFVRRYIPESHEHGMHFLSTVIASIKTVANQKSIQG